MKRIPALTTAPGQLCESQRTIRKSKRRNAALADIDFSVRKQLAQMVIGSPVAEAEL